MTPYGIEYELPHCRVCPEEFTKKEVQEILEFWLHVQQLLFSDEYDKLVEFCGADMITYLKPEEVPWLIAKLEIDFATRY